MSWAYAVVMLSMTGLSFLTGVLWAGLRPCLTCEVAGTPSRHRRDEILLTCLRGGRKSESGATPRPASDSSCPLGSDVADDPMSMGDSTKPAMSSARLRHYPLGLTTSTRNGPENIPLPPGAGESITVVFADGGPMALFGDRHSTEELESGKAPNRGLRCPRDTNLPG